MIFLRENQQEIFADQFGNKVMAMVSEVNNPNKITIQEINTYVSVLDGFQKEIMYYGARWIRKIGFKHRLSITRIETNRKRILSLTRDFRDLLSNHQSKLKKLEKSENIIRKITNLKAERKSNRNVLKKADIELKEFEKLIEQDESRMGAFGEERDLIKFNEIKEAEVSFERMVKMDLTHLEKPVHKSLMLIERGIIDADQPKMAELKRLIENPKGVLLNFADVKIIEVALTRLRELLKNNKLDLKNTRNRKALRVISSILNEKKITEYKQKFNDFSKETHKLEVGGTSDKRKELEAIKIEFQSKKEKLDGMAKEKRRIEKDIALSEQRMVEYKSKLDELI